MVEIMYDYSRSIGDYKGLIGSTDFTLVSVH